MSRWYICLSFLESVIASDLQHTNSSPNRNTSATTLHPIQTSKSQFSMCVYLVHRPACGHHTTPALCESCPSFSEVLRNWQIAYNATIPQPQPCPVNPDRHGNVIIRRVDGICRACHEQRQAEERARLGPRKPRYDDRPDGAERRSRKG